MSVLLDGRFRFDNYVVGASNRLAVAASRAVAESPGASYNPLFIYSPSGLGKTHLIGAIGFAAKQLQPDLVVEYVPLDDFVDQLHLAISSGEAEAFKQRYQRIDLLLIDDVQFLTGRRETQSEMLRIFNALQSSGRQIVMASDRPPAEIADVDERLVTRLAGGLIVDIGLPEYETRVAILRNKCAEREMTFANGVLEELARMPCGSVRELQGALNRLAAHEALGERPITPANVRSIVAGGRLTPEFGRTPVVAHDEFAGFVSDIAVAVAQHVEGWRVKLGERIAHWQRAGYRTTMLELALNLNEEADVDTLDAAFAAGVARLEQLEAQAVLSIRASPGSMCSAIRRPLPRPKRGSSRRSRRRIRHQGRGRRSRSRRSSPGSRISLRYARRRPRSKRPASDTTRSSSTAGPESARRTWCTPSGTRSESGHPSRAPLPA
jgi:hypothetical protein